MIYLDVFKFSCHSNKHYGWTRKSDHFKLTPWSFQASFMIAFSHKKIRYMATSKTFNSIKFIYFLKQVTQKLEESYSIIWDNWKFHVSKAVNEFLVNQKLLLIISTAGISNQHRNSDADKWKSGCFSLITIRFYLKSSRPFIYQNRNSDAGLKFRLQE